MTFFHKESKSKKQNFFFFFFFFFFLGGGGGVELGGVSWGGGRGRWMNRRTGLNKFAPFNLIVFFFLLDLDSL